MENKKLKAIWSPILHQSLYELDYMTEEEVKKFYEGGYSDEAKEIVRKALDRNIRFKGM
jgi:hypothetical protein